MSAGRTHRVLAKTSRQHYNGVVTNDLGQQPRGAILKRQSVIKFSRWPQFARVMMPSGAFFRMNFFQLGAFARFQNEFFSTWRSRLARFPNRFFFNTLSKDEARRMLGAENGASMVASF
jgi:hypothetical protein